MAASASDLPDTRRSSILSCRAWILSPARAAEIRRLMSSATSANGLTRRRRDALHADDDRAELALEHAADAALGQGEHRVGFGRVDDAVLGRLAEVDVLGLQVARLDDVVEARALLDLGRRRVGLGLIGEQDLLEIALFGRAELRILAGDLGVGRLGVRVADLGGIGERLRLERHDVDRAIFGRAVARLAIVEIGLQRVRPKARGCRPRRTAGRTK